MMSEHCGIEPRFFTAPWSLQGAQLKRIFDEVTHDIELHLLHDLPELAGIPSTLTVVNVAMFHVKRKLTALKRSPQSNYQYKATSFSRL